MKPLHHYKSQTGQALTSLLVIMFVGITVITASVNLLNNTMTTTGSLEEANQALIIAETGIEDSLIKLLRNPSFSGETLNVGEGTATINISAGPPTIIISSGNIGYHQRNIRVSVTFTDGIMVINSWKEI